MRGQPIKIDYTGCKRQNNVPKEDTPSINLKKLYISSLPIDATIDKIAVLFPKAAGIQLSVQPSYRYVKLFLYFKRIFLSFFKTFDLIIYTLKLNQIPRMVDFNSPF